MVAIGIQGQPAVQITEAITVIRKEPPVLEMKVTIHTPRHPCYNRQLLPEGQQTNTKYSSNGQSVTTTGMTVVKYMPMTSWCLQPNISKTRHQRCREVIIRATSEQPSSLSSLYLGLRPIALSSTERPQETEVVALT
jgi:hypothetical protein